MKMRKYLVIESRKAKSVNETQSRFMNFLAKEVGIRAEIDQKRKEKILNLTVDLVTFISSCQR